MAYEVRICARCGEREVHDRFDEAGAWVHIDHCSMGGLGGRELCKQCWNYIFNMVQAEMKHAEDKP